MRARLAFVPYLSILAVCCVTMPACYSLEVTVSTPLVVLNWAPDDGAEGIPTGIEPSVCLSEPVDEASLGFASIRPADPDTGELGPQVEADPVLSPMEERCIVFRAAVLEPGTLYLMVLEPGLRAADGKSLESTTSAGFTTEPL